MEALTARASAFAGRDRESAVLQNLLRTSAQGHTAVVFVAGEAGIGKTRLLEEAARSAQERATLLRGGASEIEGMPPYLLFLEALGPYISTAPLDQLRAQAGSSATDLASVFPEVRMRLGKLPPAYPLPPEQARLRLYEAIGRFLAAIASSKTALLLLDDLHWADPASLDLLCYAVGHQRDARLLVLGAYREGEAEANPTFKRAIERLNRSRLLTTLPLAPLGADQITELATSYLDGPVDPAVGPLLYKHSEGNPFFAEELLRCWVETDGLAQHRERWVMTPAFDPGRIPAGIAGAVHQRLARLSSDAVRHLETAAVIGRTVETSLLAAVEAEPTITIEHRLVEAVRAGLLRAGPSLSYVFSHDKIRECLYLQVPPMRRQHLHDAVGRTLEARIAQSSEHHFAELAFHFVRSEDRERGVTYSQRAAEVALRSYAAEQALGHYKVALDLLSSDDARRGGMLQGAGDAALLAEMPKEAAQAFETAKETMLRAGDRPAAAAASYGRGRALWRQGSLSAALAAWAEALDLLGDRREPLAVEVLAELAYLEAFMGRQAAGTAHAEKALELACRLGDRLLEAKARRSLGRLLVYGGDLARGLTLATQALTLAEGADDPTEVSLCCATIAYTTFCTADFERCREINLTRLKFAQRSHDLSHLGLSHIWLAMIHALHGNVEAATAEITLAHPIVDRQSSSQAQAMLLKTRGYLAYERGDYASSEQDLRAMEATYGRSHGAIAWHPGILGQVLAAAGKIDEARRYMAEQEALLADLPTSTTPTAPVLTALALMAVTLGARERAAGYHSRLAEFRGQYHWFLVDRVLAAIKILQGDWSAAEADLAAAKATAEREGMRPELGRVLVTQADLELARGGRGAAMRARTLLEQALKIFRHIGMAAEMDHAREGLRGLLRRRGDGQHPRYAAGLSSREVQVLRLVAAGLSNREIAQELALSERTVAHHLTSILNKTATGNRAAAAAFAIHHGLA